MKMISALRASLGYFRGRKLRLAVYSLLNLMELAVSIVVTYAFSRITELLGNVSAEKMIRFACLLAAVYGITLLLSALQFHLREHLEKDVRVETKQMLLDKIVSVHPSRLRSADSAKMTEILYSDVNNVTALVFSLIGFLTTVAYILLSGIVLFPIRPIIAGGLTLFLIFWSVFVAKFSQKLRALHVRLRRENDAHFKLVRDLLKNARFIYSADASEFHAARYHTSIEKVKRMTIQADVRSWALGLGNTALQNIWVVLFLIWGSTQLASGSLTVSAAVFFLLYSQRYSQSILSVLGSYAGLQQTVVSVERVVSLAEHLSTPNDDEQGSKPLSQVTQLEFRDLYYAYPGSDVETIRGLSQSLGPGLSLLIGKNGIGKSTLLNLVSGSLFPSSGAVLLNGVPVQEYQSDSLRNGISYLTQDSLLFDMSIRDNLLSFSAGDTVTEEAMRELCGQMGILDDILQLPEGFETQVSELRDFSVGQKKKLLLARTFLKPSVLVLLDEPLSGVDDASRGRIAAYIETLAQRKPVLVSTHNPGQFRGAHDTVLLCVG